MRHALWSGVAVLVICSVPLHAHAGESASNAQAEAQPAKLRDLRKAMNKAEERFLFVYNKVNRDVDQRLSCSDEAPTGSRLSKRSCATSAQTRASEEQARSYLSAIGGINADSERRNAAQADASAKAQAGVALSSEEAAVSSGRYSADGNVEVKSTETAARVATGALTFEENMRKLLDENAELRDRYNEYLTARQRFLEASGRR